jgi:hypothetical protein
MLRPVQPKLLFAALISIAIAAALNAPAMAASPSTTATSDLIPGPPQGSWNISRNFTGPMTVTDFYGSPTISAPGFSDGYRKAWYESGVEIDDFVAHYSSVAWALHALSGFKRVAQTSPKATSFGIISSFGDWAFEVTYPADKYGYKWDQIYFALGDYVAQVSLGATGAIAGSVLLDQSSRQLAGLPAATAELTATSHLIPGPAPGLWTVSGDYTGPMTANDLSGSTSAFEPGFSDAYRKAWDQPQVSLDDVVAHYDSLVWAAYALSKVKVDSQADPMATSVRSIGGLGNGAFEVTYRADTDGYLWDEIYFAVGDYVGWVSLGATGAINRGVLLDQSSRQFASLPAATGELRSIRTGILAAGAGVALVTSIAIAVTLLIVLLSQRRRATTGVGLYPISYGLPSVRPGAADLANDGRHWWDGQAWVDTTVRIPPWAPISPDGTQWWDGARWRPMPSARGAKT